jgi:iron complex outermembrane receptor protein
MQISKSTSVSLIALAITGLAGQAFAETGTAAPAVSAQPGVAQNSSAAGETDSTAIRDIVVTARKRAESLQKVPISVSVTSGLRIQEQNLSSIASLQSVTSGLVYRTTPNNLPNLTLRGLGTGTVVDSFEQSVAIFIDGTYAGRGQEFSAALFDLDQVEVIKGAQASLLSKNTSLGAISVKTKKPGDILAGDLSYNHDFHYGSNVGEAAITVPLSDTLKIRVSGKYNDQHGWVHNTYYNDDVPRAKSWGGRIVAVYEPTDAIDATLMYQHFSLRQQGLPFEYNNDPTGQIAALAATAGDPNFEATINRSKSEGDSQFGETYDHTSGNRVVGTLNYSLGGGPTLTSVSSYSDFNSNRQRDQDFIVGNYVNPHYHMANRQFQQELRISSPAEGQFLDYVGGVSFYNERWKYDDSSVVQCPNCTTAELSRFPLLGSWQGHDSQLTRDEAVFLQANVHFTKSLSAALGGRFTHDYRTAELYRDVITPGRITALLYPAFSKTTLVNKENNFDYSAGLNWKPTTRLLIYGSVSKGTKGGGFINFATNPTTASGAAAARYGTETARTYEIGEKLSLPHGGFFNVTLFDTEVSNFQNAIFINPYYLTQPRDLRSRGFELEAAQQLMPGVRLQGQVTYADVKRKDVTHLRVQGAPAWTGNVNLSFRKPLTERLGFEGDFGTEFRSSLYLTDENLTIGYPTCTPTTCVLPKARGYALLNMRVGIKSVSGWNLAVVARNLTDKLYLDYGSPAALVGSAGNVSTALGRTVSLQVGYHF